MKAIRFDNLVPIELVENDGHKTEIFVMFDNQTAMQLEKGKVTRDGWITTCQIIMKTDHGTRSYFGMTRYNPDDLFDAAIGQRNALERAFGELWERIVCRSIVECKPLPYSKTEIWKWFRQCLFNGAYAQKQIKSNLPEQAIPLFLKETDHD